MDAGDANVVHALDDVAGDLGGDGSFLGDGEVGGSGAEDSDARVLRRRYALHCDASRLVVMAGVGDRFEEGGRGFGLETGREEAVRAFEQTGRDAEDLVRGLALAQDDFRQPVAEGTVVVDAGKAQILVREVAEGRERLVDAGLSGGDGGQQVAEPLLVDGSLQGVALVEAQITAALTSQDISL